MSNNENRTMSRMSAKQHEDNEEDDESNTWSISSHGGTSRSSHDDAFINSSKSCIVVFD